jgi:hypothetical protein
MLSWLAEERSKEDRCPETDRPGGTVGMSSHWTSILIRARKVFLILTNSEASALNGTLLNVWARKMYKIADLTFNIHVSDVRWLLGEGYEH